MKILEVRPVLKSDLAYKRNPEVVPKSYITAIFQINEKKYTATIRISTNHIALCLNENNDLVSLREETERNLIDAIEKYNKKFEK